MGDPAGIGQPQRILFVTGRLAEPALRRVLEGSSLPFAWDVAVMKITVAALMTTSWIARFIKVPPGTDLVMIPGLCEGDPGTIEDACGVPVQKGPKDLRELPGVFGRAGLPPYGGYSIEIAAEINNAPKLTPAAIVAEAARFAASGADIIDLGCTPGLQFPSLGTVIKELRAGGLRVSIDSFDPDEIRTAVENGAELVLSVNASNVAVVRDLTGSAARVVIVPELGGTLDTLQPVIEQVDAAAVPFVLDPILEPIGHGFMASLERYAETRRRYPQAEMLMGIGNLTELTAADSTGVNAVLIAICEELRIRTVLTTEVIPWAYGAIREVDIARRLMHHAVANQTVPKHVDDRLVTVKDPVLLAYSEEELRQLQAQVTDPNYRIFADPSAITVFNRDQFVRGTDVQQIFDQLHVSNPAHAFYLGKELARAQLAMILHKTYRQEGALLWGYLTPPDDPLRPT